MTGETRQHYFRALGAIRVIIAITLLAIWLLSPPGAINVRAATLTVNDTVDEIHTAGCAVSGFGTCSLRDTVLYANAHSGSVISVPAGIYILTINKDGTYNGTTGALTLTANATIAGAGATSTIIDASGMRFNPDRVFAIYPGATVLLSGVTIRNGQAVGDGGGVYNAGTLTLSNSNVSNNLSLHGLGGAIYNDNGSLTVTNSTLNSNSVASFLTGGCILTVIASRRSSGSVGEWGC